MKPIFGETVQGVLFNFTQMAFANSMNEIQQIPFSSQVADELLAAFARGESFHIKSALQLPDLQKRVLNELLTQYIMFFSINPKLPFPADFLRGSNDLQLGDSLLKYLAQHRFPYPQLLPQ